MSITDELREYMLCNPPAHYADFSAIVDRIDKKHEWALSAQLESLTVDMKPMTDENMAEGGWVKLPVDADGEVIHIGDVMDTEHFGTVEVEGFVHRSVAFYNYSEQPAYLCTIPANLCHHHHEPTVEDVLREFVDEFNRDDTELCDDEIIERFAEKLREVVEHDRD